MWLFQEWTARLCSSPLIWPVLPARRGALRSGSTEPAPVLFAMGRGPEIAASSVRFSVGIENTTEEIDEAAVRIAHCVNRLRRSHFEAALPG